ncbi:MAG: hypothetical protein K2G13_03355 [Muribaculaceae bacterium]|nr:hypothetical protein [Muribaculaceae bacterium]
MGNMWLRHKSGMKQRSDNIFLVSLPPLTEEEKEMINRRKNANRQEKAKQRPEYTQEELFGGWV